MVPSTANSPFAPTQLSAVDDADDKYGKCRSKHSVSQGLCKYQEAWNFLQESMNRKQLHSMLQDSFILYALFLIAGSCLYHQLGGSFLKADFDDAMGYFSAIAEALGLLVVRRRIHQQGSVAGVSGMTIGMYALVYFLRQLLLLPPLSLNYVDMWAVETLQLTSLLLVLDILRSVFIKYKKSYQEGWDVLHVKYLIPSCIVLAILLHPSFDEGPWYSFCWTACLYLDVMALMPQVVMMGRAGSKVSAPISHFVAATTLSRVVDLSFWFANFEKVGLGGLIIFWHVVHLMLVADFMYYYLQARLFHGGFSEDLSLPTEEV
eukprot:gnl/MRDRNA2_/MRDRNA2_85351_c0_seq3.p1 gnl/MRDRNA2_/MRDRNA2_85351_c0~~gnl/MRDRNA2_/MRDRNA2_85351_c0_seq3.p1  ORF type:complete len:319 (+),score=44.45 gnl/MRDRNA2_/MRDRNA2_85351_c0_seq3:76-1032(+)